VNGCFVTKKNSYGSVENAVTKWEGCFTQGTYCPGTFCYGDTSFQNLGDGLSRGSIVRGRIANVPFDGLACLTCFSYISSAHAVSSSCIINTVYKILECDDCPLLSFSFSFGAPTKTGTTNDGTTKPWMTEPGTARPGKMRRSQERDQCLAKKPLQIFWHPVSRTSFFISSHAGIKTKRLYPSILNIDFLCFTIMLKHLI
jgi:hypothetical protein